MEIKTSSGITIFKDDASSLKETIQAAIRSGANLHYADLSGADLSGADLSGADLSGANLHYADLRSADLRYAKYLCGIIVNTCCK